MLSNAQREEDKKGKQEGRVQQVRTFGGSRWAIHRIWRKRFSAAGDPRGSDQGPGERVGRGVLLLGTTPKPPVPQRAGGIYVVMI